MANLEDRVNIVEAQSDAHARAIDGLRSEIVAVRSEMATRGDLGALRTEMADMRRDMGRRFDVMDQKLMWLAGTQVAILLAVIGALAGALYR